MASLYPPRISKSRIYNSVELVLILQRGKRLMGPETRQTYLWKPLQTRTLVEDSERTDSLEQSEREERRLIFMENLLLPGNGLDVFIKTSSNLHKILVNR